MHTNTTTNYGLPQFVGTDKPSWLGDVNGAMADIDTAIKAREVEAGTAQASADTANGKADALATRMTTAESNITALQNAETGTATQVATNTANIAQNAQDIVQLDAKIGHTQITIGDHTVTGAIATLAGQGGVEADNVEYDNTTSGLQATNVQDAIDEVAARPTVADASDVAFDNTGTGLQATNAQDAIEEVNTKASQSTANVRWNSVTDRFEVLKNSQWVQSIRAFVNSIAVFVGGVFGINVENGVHKSTAASVAPVAFVLDGTNNAIYRNINTPAGTQATLVSEEEIDFTNYSRITLVSNAGTISVDVSGYSGLGYLALCAWIASATSETNNVNIRLYASTQKSNFAENPVSGVAPASIIANGPSTYQITISEITIE